jgi:hypothetical protein
MPLFSVIFLCFCRAILPAALPVFLIVCPLFLGSWFLMGSLGTRGRLNTDAAAVVFTVVVVLVMVVVFSTIRHSPDIMDEKSRGMMSKTVGLALFLVILAIVAGLAACAMVRDGHAPARWYVAPDDASAGDTNSGGKTRPLATLSAAFAKAALAEESGGPVEIVLVGVSEETLTVENCRAVLLRGESSREPGTLKGTITVGVGADLTLGEGLTVSGTGRGVVVLGGTVTLDGGIISGNTSAGAGAGVYVSGTFTMKAGSIRGNRAVKSGGGVFVEEGTFTMTGGEIAGNISGSGGRYSGRAGGGVYVADGEFRKTGGFIGDNVVPPSYKGSQVFVARGRESKGRGAPASAGVSLDSDSNENWDE